jgi:hypothetical protein
MTADQLLDAAVEIASTWPDATITHNPVGGLAIDVDGRFVGWIDTNDGNVKLPQPKESTHAHR